MKHLFAKWLSALLIAALLLTPVAVMEEADTEAPVAVEAGNDDENPANPGEGENTDENPDEGEKTDESPAEYDDAVNAEDEPIIVEAFEASLSEAEDVDLDGADADVQEVEFELGEVEATESADALFGAGTGGSNGYVIDENTFPDAYFRAYVAEKFDNNPKDGTLSEEELASVSNIDLSAWTNKTKIASLEGIYVFNNLSTLNASGTGLTELFLSGWNYYYLSEINVVGCANLKCLSIDLGKVTLLNASNCPRLELLNCQQSYRLDQLDVSGCTNLTTLLCWRNSLSELDLRSNPNLENLSCAECCLTRLDVSACKNMTHLDCADNKLTNLDIRHCTKLTELECGGNDLAGLDISSCTNLTKLGCWGNNLTKLDISNCSKLTELDCGHNSLTDLDLSCCTKLELLSCYLNPKLKSLDISNCKVLDSVVDTNAPILQDRYDYTIVGYGPYMDEYNEEDYHLQCDEGVTIITTKNKAPAAAPAPVPAPAPAPAPAAPTVPVINATAKNTKTSIVAAPGTTAQLDLGGAAGKAFKSINRKVATVNGSGLVTFKKAGKVKITFKVGKKKRTVTIKVTDPTIPASVTITPPATAFRKGDTVTLTPVVPDGANPGGFKWKSSNKKVATVKNGVVTFKKAGKVTITCTAKRGRKKARVRFTVSK